MQEMIAEVRASPAYSTVTLASGPASAAYLEAMAKQADDHVDVCCQVPEEAFKDDAGDTTMFGTPSLLSFSELVGNVPPDGVVKVVYKYKERKVGHIVVVGPNGFQLCTCLQLLRTGLQCRHVVAALVTELKRASEFTGASIHPRWRSSLDLWSIASAGLSAFDGHERGPYRGGFTDDFEGACGDDTECEIARKSQLSVIRARTLATMIESATRSARKLVDSLDEAQLLAGDFPGFFTRLEVEIDAYISGGIPASPFGVAGTGNPPKPVTKSRKESRHKDSTANSTEGSSTKRKRADSTDVEIGSM